MKATEDSREENAVKFSRDQYGLLKSVKYNFNEDGSINWRSMIKPEFLYPNKEWFQLRKKEIPKSIEDLSDKQLLILLGGIKDLAKLRGYNSVAYSLSGDNGNVVARCEIEWIPNFENENPVRFEDVASANSSNSDKFCQKFLETIACNRAFVRCVRNFLNINIVGDDEIDKSGQSVSMDSSENSEESSYVMKPYETLEKTAIDKGINTFESFVEWLREQWKIDTYKNKDAVNWTQYSEIPAKECRKLLFILTN